MTIRLLSWSPGAEDGPKVYNDMTSFVSIGYKEPAGIIAYNTFPVYQLNASI